jgi:hypothetical protein
MSSLNLLLLKLEVMLKIRNNISSELSTLSANNVSTSDSSEKFSELVNSNNLNEEAIRKIESQLIGNIETRFADLHDESKFKTNNMFLNSNNAIIDAIYVLSTNSKFEFDYVSFFEKQAVHDIAVEMIDILRDDQIRNRRSSTLYTTEIGKLHNYVDANIRFQIGYLNKLVDEYIKTPDPLTLKMIVELNYIVLNNIINFDYQNSIEVYPDRLAYLNGIGQKLANYMYDASLIDLPIRLVSPSTGLMNDRLKQVAFNLINLVKDDWEASRNNATPSVLDHKAILRKILGVFYKLENVAESDIEESIDNAIILFEPTSWKPT